MKLLNNKLIISCLFLALSLAGCKKDSDAPSSAEVATIDASFAHAYYQLELRLIKQTAGFSPPVASLYTNLW
jgi:hypothetical protein